MENILPADAEENLSELLTCSLPFHKVKKICKMDPEVHMLAPDAVKMISKATEIFIGELAKACYTQAIIDKRKTVQKKDIDHVVKNNWLFEQLEDLLDDWPEVPVRGRNDQEKTADVTTENHTESDGETGDINASSVEDLPETVPLEDLPETEPPVDLSETIPPSGDEMEQ